MARGESLSRNIDWDVAAPFYDAFVRADFDLAFWLQAASATPGEVLELMCGTGRITVPLAKAGIPVTALDASAGLLDRLRGKVREQQLGIRLVQADVRDFALGKRFSLTFIGFHAFAEVLGRADRLRALRCVRRHVEDTGRLLVSLHAPDVRAAALHPDWRSHGTCPFGAGGTLEVSSRWDRAPDGTRVHGVQRYLERDPTGAVRRALELPITFDLIGPEEVASIAAEAGFRVADLRGDYAGSPYLPGTSPYLLFTLVPSSEAG